MRQIKIAMDIKIYCDTHLTLNEFVDENSLIDPYGKVTTLLMRLFTMEFGSPPLYAEVNRVCRTLDKTHLRTLGPYIRPLSVITREAE